MDEKAVCIIYTRAAVIIIIEEHFIRRHTHTYRNDHHQYIYIYLFNQCRFSFYIQFIEVKTSAQVNEFRCYLFNLNGFLFCLAMMCNKNRENHFVVAFLFLSIDLR